jgi:hypothetical protein
MVTAVRAVLNAMFIPRYWSPSGRMNGDFVIVEFQSFFQVVDVGLEPVLHSEVVDDHAEDDVSGAVAEEARGVWTLPVAVAGEVLDEADLR